MIQKGTYLFITDKSGVWWCNVFHLYKGFKKKFTKGGNFVKVSVRVLKTKNNVKKKSKFKSFIILTKNNQKKNDNSKWNFKLNSGVLLKKRLNMVSKELYGPTLSIIKRKKFNYSFSGIL